MTKTYGFVFDVFLILQLLFLVVAYTCNIPIAWQVFMPMICISIIYIGGILYMISVNVIEYVQNKKRNNIKHLFNILLRQTGIMLYYADPNFRKHIYTREDYRILTASQIKRVADHLYLSEDTIKDSQNKYIKEYIKLVYDIDVSVHNDNVYSFTYGNVLYKHLMNMGTDNFVTLIMFIEKVKRDAL